MLSYEKVSLVFFIEEMAFHSQEFYRILSVKDKGPYVFQQLVQKPGVDD